MAMNFDVCYKVLLKQTGKASNLAPSKLALLDSRKSSFRCKESNPSYLMQYERTAMQYCPIQTQGLRFIESYDRAARTVHARGCMLHNSDHLHGDAGAMSSHARLHNGILCMIEKVCLILSSRCCMADL
jgi:hypothetical protein